MEFFFMDKVIMGHLLNEDPNCNIIVTVAMENNRSLERYMGDHLYDIMEMMARKGLLYFYIDGNIRQVLSHMKDDSDNILKRQQLGRAIQNLCPRMGAPAIEYYIDSILGNRDKIMKELSDQERVDIPQSEMPYDFYKQHFDYLARKHSRKNRKESPVYTLQLLENEKGVINTILIGNLYEIHLNPQEMALYALVLYLGKVKVSYLVHYTKQLEELNKKAHSKKISDERNRETIRKIVDGQSLTQLTSKINGAIQEKLSVNPDIYDQYLLEKQPTSHSDVLRIRLDRKNIIIPPSIFKIFTC